MAHSVVAYGLVPGFSHVLGALNFEIFLLFTFFEGLTSYYSKFSSRVGFYMEKGHHRLFVVVVANARSGPRRRDCSETTTSNITIISARASQPWNRAR